MVTNIFEINYIRLIESLQYFCFFQNFFPVSSHLLQINSFMATMSPLKRALFVDSNEPRPSSSRSRHSQMFFKIGVLKDFALFTGKKLCWSLFLTNFQAWRPATLLKRDSSIGIFSFFYITPPVVASVRSSHPEMFCKKGVLKNLAKFTGKQLCWSLFFNKVAGLFSPNTSGGCICSVLLPWRLHHKWIWVAKDLRERNFLWRNK